MELRHLRYFVTVAEELHFSRAAARLHMAQPPLSQQIRRLEEEIGVTLFTRTRRRVELTAAGREFLREAQTLLELSHQAVRTAQRASRGEIGRLAIGFVASADLDVLPRVLRVWHRRFPQVEIVLHGLLPAPQIEALREGRIQVGFLRLPVDEAGVVVERIQREPLVAVLPARHRLAQRARVRLSDLAGEPMVLFPRELAPGYYDLYVGACRQAGFTPRVAHEALGIQTNLGLVAAGLGFTLLPSAIRNLRRSGVVYRPLAPPTPQTDMALAYLREQSSPVLKAFCEIAREVTKPRRAARR